MSTVRPFRRLRGARRRGLAALAVASLASGVLVAATAGGPALAAPAEDCAQPVDVADVADGDTVDGLTVVEGTTPTSFTGEVLGTLTDGIAPGIDMIMIDLSMPEFERSGGVWGGMSGSPVYDADGGLIGAVAYGLSYGPSTIAGITPFEAMDNYLAQGQNRRVRLQGRDARVVAREAGISERAAANGFTQLPMPLGVNGVSARSLAEMRESGPKRLFRQTYAAGRAAAADADADTIVAGGNLATSAAYGDISLTAVGTATSVCGDRVVGFGHPAAFLGQTTQGLHPADALFVQPESLGAPFKVANVAPPVGTITDDRTAGVTGTFGAVPTGAEVTNDLTYGDRDRFGETGVFVPDFLPDVTAYQVLANHDRVVDGPSDGSELFTWTATGTQDGDEVELTFTDRYASRYLQYDTAFSMFETVYQLQSFDDFEIDRIDTTSEVVDDRRTHTLNAIEQYRDGRWRKVTREAPARGVAGKPLRLRAVLGGSAGREIVPLGPITLPERSPGRLVISASGGDSDYAFLYDAKNLDDYAEALADQLRNDQLRVQVGTPDKVEQGFDEGEFYFEGRGRERRPSFVRTRTTAPFDHVVSGIRNLTVRVR